MRKKASIFFFLFLLSFGIKSYGSSDPIQEEEFEAWWTGPLIAPAGHTLSPGLVNWEPYLFVTDDFGFYDHSGRHHSIPNTLTVNPLLSLTLGINSFMDTQLILQTVYNRKEGRSAFRVGDTTLFLGFQVLEDKMGAPIPDLRITFNQIFPTGQYQELDPEKKGTDASGLGSWREGVSVNFQKVFHIIDYHHLRLRLSFTYTYHIPVHIKGFNSYGGGFRTKGKVFPGSTYVTDFAFEYNLTQNWVLAMDVLYTYANKTRFSGRPGVNADGSLASVGKGSSDNLSLAPAIEYNFSAYFGIIGGVWFSVKGRNTDEFISGVIAVNIAY